MISATPPSLTICTGVNIETELQVNLGIFRMVLKIHFLGYDAMVLGKQFLTLWRIIVPSSTLETSRPLKMQE
jgi:hypothetical protein